MLLFSQRPNRTGVMISHQLLKERRKMLQSSIITGYYRQKSFFIALTHLGSFQAS